MIRKVHLAVCTLNSAPAAQSKRYDIEVKPLVLSLAVFKTRGYEES